MKKVLFTIASTFLCFAINSQPSNEDCSNSITLSDATQWCSQVSEFTNDLASASGYNPANCWDNSSVNDVWFDFTAFFTDVVITAIGDVDFGMDGGTMATPQIALYSGTCGGTINELRCESAPVGQGIVELIRGGLTLGERYFIRVDGGQNTGSFQLCVNNYNPPVDPGQDCVTGAILCDKSPFSVELLTGAGSDNNEAANSCIGGLGGASEQQSTWYRWTAASDGTLGFTISPNNPSDDLDFVLYELPSGINICADKIVIRCMATACQGPTGLNASSTDVVEDANCDPGEDGFVREIDMITGTSYALLINNFSNTGSGYSLEFSGTGEFQGPQAAFEITPESGLRCEEDFVVTDMSSFGNGQITSWTWNFGEGAVPQTATGPGPHNVIYNSIGTKFISMQIETDLGCIVTDVRQLEAEPCCEDLDDLNGELLEAVDLSCAGVPSGEIAVSASGGTPDYKYSIAGGEFEDIIRFQMLDAGDYEIKVLDAHGCRDSFMVQLSEPEEIIVELGPDRDVDLGATVIVTPEILPIGAYEHQWCPSEGIDDTLNLDVSIVAPGETVYILKVTDENGCRASDSMRIRVSDERPVFIPNAFSPNGDGLNDELVVFTNSATERLESVQIFDRWGSMVFDAKDIPPGRGEYGWDGSFKGELMQSAVYTVVAKVKFIDGESRVFSGDLTLVR